MLLSNGNASNPGSTRTASAQSEKRQQNLKTKFANAVITADECKTDLHGALGRFHDRLAVFSIDNVV